MLLLLEEVKTSEQLYIAYKTLIIDHILSGYFDIIISVGYGGLMTTLFLGLPMPQAEVRNNNHACKYCK